MDQFAPGTVLENRYRIELLLGMGGMGAVYKAEDFVEERFVALKVLQRSLENEKALIRFRREFSAMRKLDHPNVVKAYDLHESDELSFLTMEYVEGESLRKIEETKQKLPLETNLKLLLGIVEGLKHAHDHGLIHRDLKPDNVLVSKDGVPKLVDFGIARDFERDLTITDQGQPLGTASYMSPEQWRREPLDARADIYSLGVVAYELLTGRHPFEAQAIGTMYISHVAEPPRSIREKRPELPRWVDDFVSTCLEKDPAHRYQKAGDILALFKLRLGAKVSFRERVLSDLSRLKYRFKKEFRRSEVNTRQILLSAGIAFFVTFSWLPFGKFTDLLLDIGFHRLRGPITAPSDVVIVGIDDLTYKSLGISPRLPFPRAKSAAGLQRIQDDHPKLVFLDLLAQNEESDAAANEKLITALKSGPSVIGTSIQFDPSDPSSDDPRRPEFEYPSHKIFAEAARMVAPLALRETLGVVSAMSISLNPSVPVEARVPLIRPLEEIAGLSVGSPGTRDFISYYGKPGSIPRLSFFQVLQESFPKRFFKDKYVFVGFQSMMRERGTKDAEMFVTPVSTEMYGVEVHTTIASNLIDNSWVRRFSPLYELWFIYIASFVICLAASPLRPLSAIYRSFLGVTLWFALSFYSFAHFSYFVPGSLHFMLTASVAFAMVALYQTHVALKSKKKLQKQLGLKEDI